MMFVIKLVLFVVATALSYIFRAKPKTQQHQAADMDGDSFPMADAGAVIPVVFGTRWVKTPNCVWYGDVQKVAIKEKVSSSGKK